MGNDKSSCGARHNNSNAAHAGSEARLEICGSGHTERLPQWRACRQKSDLPVITNRLQEEGRNLRRPEVIVRAEDSSHYLVYSTSRCYGRARFQGFET